MSDEKKPRGWKCIVGRTGEIMSEGTARMLFATGEPINVREVLPVTEKREAQIEAGQLLLKRVRGFGTLWDYLCQMGSGSREIIKDAISSLPDDDFRKTAVSDLRDATRMFEALISANPSPQVEHASSMQTSKSVACSTQAERQKWDEFHGCFTGDCPHGDVNDCIKALREAARESDFTPQAEGTEFPEDEFWRSFQPDGGPAVDPSMTELRAARWGFDRALRSKGDGFAEYVLKHIRLALADDCKFSLDEDGLLKMKRRFERLSPKASTERETK